jgi:predicted CDP-diglyceride synthetase/phosphatidate cytidylyltransferase
MTLDVCNSVEGFWWGILVIVGINLCTTAYYILTAYNLREMRKLRDYVEELIKSKYT